MTARENMGSSVEPSFIARVAAGATSGIYTITHIETGRMYVGQSVNMRKRLHAHRNNLRKMKHGNPKLQSAFVMYGEASFLFEELECCPEDCLDGMEQFWMNMLDSKFNLAPAAGSVRGVKFSTESKRRMREVFARPDVKAKRKKAAKEKWLVPGFRENLSKKAHEQLVGKKQSPELIAKRTAWQLGHKYDEAFCAKVSAAKKAKNFKFSEESKEKMRQSHLGYKASPESIAKRLATIAARKAAGYYG